MFIFSINVYNNKIAFLITIYIQKVLLATTAMNIVRNKTS